MAELALCNTVLTMLESLALPRRKVKSLADVECGVSILRQVFEDAASKKLEPGSISHAVLTKATDLLYDLCDPLERVIIAHNEPLIDNKFIHKVSCSPLKKFHIHAKMDKALKKFRDDLDRIAPEASMITEGRLRPREVLLIPRRRREKTCSYVYESSMIGRDEDRKVLVNMLLDSNDKIGVIPMVGKAGLGKTALAQLVYNDPRVESQFDLRIWLCTSYDEIDLGVCIREIISSARDDRIRPDLPLDYLISQLRQLINGKRFFLVLDDLWLVNKYSWEKFRELFSGGATGCKILVTTRLTKVAQIVGTTPPYELRCLSEDDSWHLFKSCAFSGQGEADPELTEMGKEIMRYCECIPLAIKIVASYLYEQSYEKWLYVLNKVRELGNPIEWITSPEMGCYSDAETSESSRSESFIPRESYSYVDEANIIGRDKDREVLVDMLLDIKDKVEVIPIVGITGLGKTALAQLVFNDRRVINHFELRMWVYISNECNVRSIVSRIILSAVDDMSGEDLPLDHLVTRLRQGIDGKLFFLVLDSFPLVKKYDWDKLRELFRGGARGSEILVTTSSTEMLQIMGKVRYHELECLAEKDSRHLFERMAFEQGKVDRELIDIGKEIVRRCENMPLAVQLVGSRLYGESKQQWQCFLDQIRQLQNPRELVLELMRIAHVDYTVPPSNMKASEEVPLVPRESYSYVDEANIIGRDEDRQVLVDLVLNSSDKVDVIPIVGIAGLGKTTLAQLVFNDRRVIIQFELRMWVCIDEFDLKDILRKIIVCAGYENVDHYGIEHLYRRIQDVIHGKLFLLVLDNMGEASLAHWLFLREMLTRGARGSKVLVTTRASRMAKRLGDTEPYKLKGLSDEDSRSLFEKTAFGPEERHQELIEIGNEIVRHCQNVPLVIRITGSLLYRRNKERWLSILQQIRQLSRPSELTSNLNNIAHTSYYELPINLRACLAYCSLFPIDYELNKHDLISLWMAQEFIQPEEDQSMENLGEQYFVELLQRGFLKDGKKGKLGDISTCKKHIMCDIVESTMRSGSGVLKSESDIFDSSIRHVSLDYKCDLISEIPPSLIQAQKIRTLLWMKVPALSDLKLAQAVCNMILSNFKSLRVLDLHDLGIRELPGSISELFHLRYLDLSKSDIVELPKSLTGMYYLQTLKLNFCEKLKKLPNTIGKLVNLRRLEIDECDSLIGIPLGLERLRNLQTLSRFIVGKASSEPKRYGGLKVLMELNNLKGRLTIELFEEWTTVIEGARLAELCRKSELSELRIDWRVKRPQQVDPNQYKALLEGLQPHPNLKLLCIEGYRGKDFPMWASMGMLASSLPNLVVLSIEGGNECKHLPSFCQLLHLKRLTLRFMDGVEHMESKSRIPQSEPFFPSLEELTVHSLTNLKGWWEEEAEVEQQSFPSFPRLLKLKIWNCPKLMQMPLFPHVQELDLLNVNQKLLQDSRASSATIDATSSVVSHSLSRSSSIANSFQNLRDLERLQIKGCLNMKSFPALVVSQESSGVSSLKYLVVEKCDELRSLAEGLQYFSSLEELDISGCRELNFSLENQENGMPWKSLSRLRYLTFRDIPKMEKLPEGLQYVPTLRFLCVSLCNNLQSLPDWLSSLTSLVHLRIECCPLLVTLPNALKGLRSLTKVEIIECPELVERCREQTGEEWHKIQHARVLLHKSWRYGLLSDEGHSQLRQQNHRRVTGGTCNDVVHEDNVIAQFKDAVVHVTGATVTISKLQCNTNDTRSDGN